MSPNQPETKSAASPLSVIFPLLSLSKFCEPKCVLSLDKFSSLILKFMVFVLILSVKAGKSHSKARQQTLSQAGLAT